MVIRLTPGSSSTPGGSAQFFSASRTFEVCIVLWDVYSVFHHGALSSNKQKQEYQIMKILLFMTIIITNDKSTFVQCKCSARCWGPGSKSAVCKMKNVLIQETFRAQCLILICAEMQKKKCYATADNFFLCWFIELCRCCKAITSRTDFCANKALILVRFF